MTKFHLLWWMFDRLSPEDVEKLCCIDEKMSDNAKCTVGELFQERRDAYRKSNGK